jgi:hypothetical protein
MAELAPAVWNAEDDVLVNWTLDPEFIFETEIDALTALQQLGEELRSAREHLEHCMRYMRKAVRAARAVEEDGHKVSKQAIIGSSGLARQTVYDMLTEE